MSKYPIKHDLTGLRFAKLHVIERSYKKKKVAWLCKCDCGNYVIVETTSLRRKNFTKSCGCYQIQKTQDKNRKHGKKGSRIYNIWNSMCQRCLNNKSYAYKWYGGRGITLCEGWKNFERFYEDMGDPEKGMSLDRIDNSKGYYKENCRWTSVKVQNNNRRTDKTLFFRGKEYNILDLFKEFMIPLGFNNPSCLYRRLKNGVDLETALFTKGRIVPKKYNIKTKKKKDKYGRFCK